MKKVLIFAAAVSVLVSCKNETYEDYFRRNMTDAAFSSTAEVAEGIEAPTYSKNKFQERKDSLFLKAVGNVQEPVILWDFDSITKTDTVAVYYLAASSKMEGRELYDTVELSWVEAREEHNPVLRDEEHTPTFKRVKNLERTQTVKAEAKTAGCVYDSKGERIDFMIIGDQVYVHSQFMKVGGKMTEVHKLPAYIKYEVQYREIQ